MKNNLTIRILGTALASLLLTTSSANSAEAASPKCTGQTLKSYKKNLKLYTDVYNEMVQHDGQEDYFRSLGLYDKWYELHRLQYQVWLSYGWSLSPYAKKCKVKMGPEWQEMLDSLPD